MDTRELPQNYEYYDPNSHEQRQDLNGRTYTEDIVEFPLDNREAISGNGPDFFVEERDGKYIRWNVTLKDSSRTLAGGRIDPRTHMVLKSGDRQMEVWRDEHGKFRIDDATASGQEFGPNWKAGTATRRYSDEK